MEPRPPIPLLATGQFVEWLQTQASFLFELQTHELRLAQSISQFMPTLLEAYNTGCLWIVLDGPRPQRPQWLLDPWWKEQPEMTVSLQAQTQSHCVTLPEAYELLQKLPPTDQPMR